MHNPESLWLGVSRQAREQLIPRSVCLSQRFQDLSPVLQTALQESVARSALPRPVQGAEVPWEPFMDVFATKYLPKMLALQMISACGAREL